MKKSLLGLIFLLGVTFLFAGPPKPPTPYAYSQNPPQLNHFTVQFFYNNLTSGFEARILPKGNNSFSLHVLLKEGTHYFWCEGDESLCKAIGNGQECPETKDEQNQSQWSWCYVN